MLEGRANAGMNIRREMRRHWSNEESSKNPSLYCICPFVASTAHHHRFPTAHSSLLFSGGTPQGLSFIFSSFKKKIILFSSFILEKLAKQVHV